MKNTNKDIKLLYDSIIFTNEEIHRFLGSFIFPCSDYKLILAGWVTKNFAENSYSLNEILNILDGDMQTASDIIAQLHSENEDFKKLGIELHTNELFFFSIAKNILRTFLIDLMVESLRHLHKHDKTSFNRKYIPNPKALKHIRTAYKEAASKTNPFSKTLESLYPKPYSQFVELAGGTFPFPFVKLELLNAITDFNNFPNQHTLLIPNICELFDVLSYKTFQYRTHISNNSKLLKSGINYLNEIYNIMKDNPTAIDNIISTSKESIDKYSVNDRHSKNPLKAYKKSDLGSDLSNICSMCSEFHCIINSGYNYYISPAIDFCIKRNSANLTKFKSFFKSGSLSKPTNFQQFITGNIILEYFSELNPYEETDFKNFFDFFNGTILVQFYKLIKPEFLSCYFDDIEMIVKNELVYIFTIASNGKSDNQELEQLEAYGRYEVDLSSPQYVLKGIDFIESLNYDDSFFIQNKHFDDYFNENSHLLTEILEILYLYLICINFSDKRFSDIDLNCLKFQSLICPIPTK